MNNGIHNGEYLAELRECSHDFSKRLGVGKRITKECILDCNSVLSFSVRAPTNTLVTSLSAGFLYLES